MFTVIPGTGTRGLKALQITFFCTADAPHRTQEVAGSSPASST
jgi:hypothetical protein